MSGDAGNEPYEFLRGRNANSNNQLSAVAGREESPTQEFTGVVKTEHILIILHVVVGEEVVHFVNLNGEGYIGVVSGPL